MVVKDFFDVVFEKILLMNVAIKIIVSLIKINVINVVIVDGSMLIFFRFISILIFLGNVFEWA
jgi:hypothetical protein